MTLFFNFRESSKMEADSDQFKFSVQGKTIVFKMGPMYEEDSLIDVREKVSSALTLAM